MTEQNNLERTRQNKNEIKKQEPKDIYFIILYPRKQQEKPDEFAFRNDINPKSIYTEEIKYENGTYAYKKVFKFNGKTNERYKLEFKIGDDQYSMYIIDFEVKENSFIYDVQLKKQNVIICQPLIINQSIIDYHKKLDIFLDALKKNNEENKKDILFKNTIDLFGKKKGFSFLISLFVHIYKDKELCHLLINKFKKMNIEITEFEKNMDRNKDLEQYINTFYSISSEAKNLIKSNSYDPVQFYSIILCYFNYYEHNYFIKIFQELYIERCKILYEILLIYHLHFLNPINQNINFYVKFIDYCISKNDCYTFKNVLDYITDIETFIIVIDRIKEKIIKKYADFTNSFYPIQLKDNLEIIKKERNKEFEAIINAIRSINNFSKEYKILLVYFENNFWIKLLKEYNMPDDMNIYNCYKLRETFIEYKDIVNKLYEKDKKCQIRKDINTYFERDEFAFLLDRNIKKMFENNRELSNYEIIGFIGEFNPYYKEKRYFYKVDTYFFDYINLEDENESFIETFKILDFETMFRDKIIEFLNKMISKIKNIPNFGTILELIDINKITKVKEYFTLLKDKYEKIVKKQINSLTGKELNNAAKIVAKFVDLMYSYEKNCEFIADNIDKLDEMICSLIYHELLRRCKGNEYKMMKEFIYGKFLKKLENINIIIDHFYRLEEGDKNLFFESLTKKCKFTKEEFYSNDENIKIELLCYLNDKGILKMTDQKYFDVDIGGTITQIYNDLEGEIIIKKLEEFLEDEEKDVIKRLKLIKIFFAEFEPEKEYKDLKKLIEQIKKDIKELSIIKNSLSIFLKNKYLNEIRKMSEIINIIEEKNINYYKSENTIETIKKLKYFKNISEEINNVKDFLLFKALYNDSYENNQEMRFNKALNQLKNIKELIDENANASKIYERYKEIFNKVKEMISNDESEADAFIKKMIDYFEIEEKKELITDFSLIFKSKIYEMDLKRIIYFFENLDFEKDNKWNEKVSSKYKKLSKKNPDELKKCLKELKDDGIYDYEKTNKNYKLFTYLYEKIIAIDFLLYNKDISYLYNRIDSTNMTIARKNIKDTEECIKIFYKFNELNDNSKILEYIKTKLTKEDISKFEIYSKIYPSIIELDRNDYSSINLYKQVNDYIQDATFIFREENEDFSYGKSGRTNLEELIHLKNKIHIKPPKDKEIKDKFHEKYLKLVFFKNLVSNLELIYEYMQFLRNKGSSLPIIIAIKIKYPTMEYILNKEKVNFTDVKEFLFLVKNDYITQLDSIYKTSKYLRFLFGKVFRNIIRHLYGDYNASDIIRFILNKTNSKEEIKDGYLHAPIITLDYVNDYKIYIKKNFNDMSIYFSNLFDNNGKSLQKHYESMLLKNKNKYKEYKGIYLYECKSETMEEFILSVYWDKMNQSPIAQNILFCSKETSQEEMQAFLYRAILCDYNTLFIVGIKNSFSDFQQNTMVNYIDTLLRYQNKKHQEINNKRHIYKGKTGEYLTSCIIFVFEQNNLENIFLLFELKRFALELNLYKSPYIKEDELDRENLNNMALFPPLEENFSNIKVITSDICGLGKSFKIKKMIEKDKKNIFISL